MSVLHTDVERNIDQNLIEAEIERYLDRHLHELRQKLFNLDDLMDKKSFKKLAAEHDLTVKQLNGLQQDNRQMHAENSLYLKQIDTLSKALMQQENINQRQQQEISQKDTTIAKFNLTIKQYQEIVLQAQGNKEALHYFQTAYGDMDMIFKNYQNLAPYLKSELAGIFGKNVSPLNFFSCAVQEQHLGKFYDYLQHALNNDLLKQNEQDILQSLFSFCFMAVNYSAISPIYRRLVVKTGSRFDIHTMIKSSNSSQLGCVKRLLLAGYAYEATGRIVKSSLVEVGE